MVTVIDLWLPILIASVVVFFASAIIWMLLPHHKKDIKFLKDHEPKYLEAIKAMGLAPGLYMYPGCDLKDIKTDEGKARYDAGPWGTLIAHPEKPNFGMNLVKTFIIYTLITVFVGYITGISLRPGTEYMMVFRVAATTAILGHCMGGLVNDVFIGRPTRFILTNFIDGVIYALLTAGVIASMWPKGQNILDHMIIPAIN